MYKPLLRLFITCASSGWIPFFSVTNVNNMGRFTKRPVAPSSAASCPSLSYFSSLRRVYPLWVTLTDVTSPCLLMSGPFVFKPPFLFQIWPGQIILESFLRPLANSCFLLLMLGKFSLLLVLLFHRGTHLPSLWSWLFLHAPALTSLFHAKVQLSLTLALSHVTIW